jgi:hypothetical protein
MQASEGAAGLLNHHKQLQECMTMHGCSHRVVAGRVLLVHVFATGREGKEGFCDREKGSLDNIFGGGISCKQASSHKLLEEVLQPRGTQFQSTCRQNSRHRHTIEPQEHVYKQESPGLAILVCRTVQRPVTRKMAAHQQTR